MTDAAEPMRDARRDKPAAPDTAGPARPAPRLSHGEAAELTAQVSALARAGLPLAPGLRALAAELPRGPLGGTLRDLADRLDAGDSLDAAIAGTGGRLPGHLASLVRAGVRSHKLGDVLEQYARVHEVSRDLRRRAWMSLVYPIILLCALGELFAFFLLVVVRQFEMIYRDFGMTLPGATQSLIELSRAAREISPVLALGAVLCVAVGWAAARAFLTAAQRRRLAYRVPLLGALWRWVALAHFCRLLAVLLESELALPAALDLAGPAVGDAEIADAARRLGSRIETGEAVAASAAALCRFPRILTQILAWGEMHQALPEAVHTAAEMFEARARIQIAYIGQVLPPILVLTVVLAVGYLVIALFMPLIMLIRALSL